VQAECTSDVDVLTYQEADYSDEDNDGNYLEPAYSVTETTETNCSLSATR
jgi:hypothetical protein